ncbi:MAG: DUF1580 domain-containing protein [Planctomycetaceae bacterium]|nr:DUF1580 domain-containing protein [Planctomycetaceae bacterium]
MPATLPAARPTRPPTAVTTSFIDPEHDDLRPVNQIIKARVGKPSSPATLWRWRLKGVNGVRLECLRLGGCWVTTDAAFAEFLRAQTQNALAACQSSADDRPAERSPETVRRLKAEGVL